MERYKEKQYGREGERKMWREKREGERESYTNHTNTRIHSKKRHLFTKYGSNDEDP